ncbi:MAG: hypothetical protein R2873_35465 [Caldilineaceae bacterium]
MVSETGVFAADVGIEGDKIAVVARPGALPSARQERNAEGLLIFPGVIDIHFHVRPSPTRNADMGKRDPRRRRRWRHHAV